MHKDNKISPDFNHSLINQDDIKAEAQAQASREPEPPTNGLFVEKSVNTWIEDVRGKPTPKKLFDNFWFEGEICILFADTGAGKSLLAVQVGDSLSTGTPVPGFTIEADAQIVLYFDFELSPMQFRLRYSDNYGNPYNFSDNLRRIEINPEAEPPDGEDFEAYLCTQIEAMIIKTKSNILIIDNITYLRTDNEKSKDALPLMKYLKRLKNKYGLSILILAHTPKTDQTQPISRNHLAGSKMLMNFCDSSFAIGESCAGNSLRYLKQIKVRNVAATIDSSNIILCQITKREIFTGFEFVSFGEEKDHLKKANEKGLNDAAVIKYLFSKKGIVNRSEIARILNVSQPYVSKILKDPDSYRHSDT